MPSAAGKPAASPTGDYDPSLIGELNALVPELLARTPVNVIEQGLRKMIRGPLEGSDAEAEKLFNLAATLTAALHLFTPSLSGVRPVDRLARAAAGQSGGLAMAAVARSKFGVYRVESLGAAGRGTARDRVTGSVYPLVTEGLDPVVTEFDIATRLCPVGGGLWWPMGPFVPVGYRGEENVGRFPSRPGKGLINEGAVAAQIYREYIRAGAPLGVDFGIAAGPALLSYIDDPLLDHFAASRASADGPIPSGERLAALRNLASIPRLAMALSSEAELMASGKTAEAAIFHAAARVFLDVLTERARVGSHVSLGPGGLKGEIAAVFAPKPTPAAVAALLGTMLAEAGPAAPTAKPDADLARVVERIRALRQKTVEMGCTEQEAMRAAEKVAELLERYGLTLSEIELRKQTCEGFGFDTGRKQGAPLDECLRVVAEFCDCRTWSERAADGGLRQVFFGLPADIEAARCLKDLVTQAFDVETEAFKRADLYRAEPASGRRAMVKSFQIGLGGGISTKLLALKAAREKAATKSRGRDLVVVKRSIVEEEMEKLGLSFRTKTKRRNRVIADAYQHGVVASHRFEVNEKVE